MKTDALKNRTALDFVFADETHISFEFQLSDSVITETVIDPGPPELRENLSITDLFGINELLFFKDTFPYYNIWYKYAQLSAAERYLHYPSSAETELLRIMIFEYLRIAEYLFCLATFSLNAGLNEIHSGLMKQYTGLSRFLNFILDKITPFEIVCGIKRFDDLPAGFIEKNLKYLAEIQPQYEILFKKLLRNQIVADRCRGITAKSAEQFAFSYGGPNQRAAGVSADRRYDFPYSYYHKLYFDSARPYKNSDQTWQRLKIRCEEIFSSFRLIRQAANYLVYEKPSRRAPLPLAGMARGHARSLTETPWGFLSCQMNFSGVKDPCEFIMTNLQHSVRLYLRQAAVGLDPGDFSLLASSLGLRPDAETK